MRGEGRSFPHSRCLIPATHFYEFTGKSSPKTRWRFTKSGDDWFCLAGIVGKGESNGQAVEAFTMLTVPAGLDVAPIHHRQVVVLERSDWARWLDPTVPSQDLVKSSPAGVLSCAQAPRLKALER
jgi:putative SOS response-associated peptidase YedK